jgi:DhnA family fructose-bisphosphate aldolase class Ia
MAYLAQSAVKANNDTQPELHAVRVAQELGADIIKVANPGNNDILEDMVSSSQVPLIVGGGPRHDDLNFIENIRGMMAAGIDGVAVGRQVFQSPDIAAELSGLYAVVHNPQAVSRLSPAR